MKLPAQARRTLREFAISLALARVLVGADSAAQPSTGGWSGPWDLIAFEVKSWGRPVTSWRLLADGSGSWTEAVRDDGTPPGRNRLVRDRHFRGSALKFAFRISHATASSRQ